MNLTQILKEKKENNIKIKDKFEFLQKNKSIGLVMINNIEILNNLIYGLNELPSSFVIIKEGEDQIKISKNIISTNNIDDNLLSGFDFVICDEDICNFQKMLEKGITPIVPKDFHLNSLLNEFNPMKNEGNSYFYNNNNSYSIFYSIVRYLENYKFPFDNKNLVQNVLKI